MHHQRGTVVVRGPQSMRLATSLLQRARLASPTGGIWEAADVQWWSRQECPTDVDGQLFWLDDGGEPVAAVLRSAFVDTVQCDVIVPPDDKDFESVVWATAVERAAEFGASAEFPVRLDDNAGLAALRNAGYQADTGPGVVTCWLDAAARPPVPDLAAGYQVLSRAQDSDRPHPMVTRNGASVATRLSQSSLYRPELDLVVRTSGGEVAGYGLFWADPVTGVGLVEPMRTEDAHQGRGLAGHVLAVGLDLLARAGCNRLKVSNDIALYLRAGFRRLDSATAAVYSRS